MQLSKAKLKQMKSTGGILGLFIRFALAAQKSFIFPRVGGTQHASSVSESRSCQSVVFVLISCPHPPTTSALIQLHKLGGHERTDRRRRLHGHVLAIDRYNHHVRLHRHCVAAAHCCCICGWFESNTHSKKCKKKLNEIEKVKHHHINSDLF